MATLVIMTDLTLTCICELRPLNTTELPVYSDWRSLQQHRFQNSACALRISVFHSYSSCLYTRVLIHTYCVKIKLYVRIVLETKARGQLHIPTEWIWKCVESQNWSCFCVVNYINIVICRKQADSIESVYNLINKTQIWMQRQNGLILEDNNRSITM
jgi:hypothetical protein